MAILGTENAHYELQLKSRKLKSVYRPIYIHNFQVIFRYYVVLKRTWNYAFSAHEIQNFLRKQPTPEASPLGPRIIFLFLASAIVSGFSFIPLWFWCIGGLKTIVSYNTSTLPSFFQSYDAPICNVLIFGINHIVFGYDFIFWLI